jgi:PKD repeat protein
LLIILLGTTLSSGSVGLLGTAYGDTDPPDEGTPATVSSDPLPTAQMDGVAWTQLVVGNTVFVGGSFLNARPANAAPGVSTVTRTHLMAYTLSTGEMTSFAPTLNGQVRALAASADGSTLYVGGQFTTVNGVTRNRIAAFNTATGALTSFAPNLNSTVFALGLSGSTLYLAGTFTSVNGTTRTNGAGINLNTGVLTGFAPAPAGGSIQELAVSPDGSRVVVGGNFTTMSSSANPGYGLALLDAGSGANLPLPANGLVRDAGANAAITSLFSAPDGSGFYGSGYSFQKTTGNLEGAFKADWNGTLIWLEDCHGDTYSVFPWGGALYAAGHEHFCGNIGGFPQTTPWTYQRAVAFRDLATGAIQKEQYGYYNFEGQPQPSLLSWYPDINTGTFTGQDQGPWSVAGNDDYVVYGGEFTTVNFKAQQGLVRFARTGLAPNTDGPRLQNADFVPTITSYAHGVRLSWPANHDRDNEQLTYSVIKNGNTANPIYTTTLRSAFWLRPRMSFLDRKVTPGTAVTYRLRVTDPKGNVRQGDPITVTPSGGGVLSAYEKAALADSPLYYWPLNEASGSDAAVDVASAENGTIGAQVTAGVPGALSGEPGTAFRYSGTDTTSTVATQTQRPGLGTFSLEAWFRSTSITGGKIIGWGTKSSGASGNSDRMIYLGRTGKVYFGVYPAAYKTVASTASYNDGQWHHVVASLGSDGMKLYIDGGLVGSLAGITQPQLNSGYWRVGGDYMSGWPDNPPLSSYYAGDIDNAAVYNYVLTPAQVAAHRAPPSNVAPVASFTTNMNDLSLSADAAASTDTDGVVAGYAWDFGDGSTGSGATATHAYADPGNYTVTLTVTDENGGTNSTTQQVTATASNVPPTAAFTFSGTELEFDFDGSDSTDADGTITSYAWNFGDGSTGSGASPTHTYATGGTYDVTLTVTDDRNGTDTETHQVTAVAPADHPFAADAFDRTLASGLGTADLGGSWTTSGASGFSVGSGAGTWKLNAAGASRTAYLGSTLKDSTDLTMDISPSAIGNGGGTYLTVLGRRISSTLDYRANVRITNANKVTVSLGALQGSSTANSLSNTITVPGTLSAGEVIHVRMQTFGSQSTTIRAKVWLGSASEPSSWTVSATDGYAGLQAPGSVGLTAYLSSSSTNAPINVNVLDLVARPVT